MRARQAARSRAVSSCSAPAGDFDIAMGGGVQPKLPKIQEEGEICFFTLI